MNHMSDVTLPAVAPEFILTRIFDAPRPLVFKCWMEPSHLARWWGSRTFTCPVCEVDARVGGKFKLVMRGLDGAEYPMSGTFRDIVPNVRIVKEDDASEHSEEWHDMVDPERKGQGKRKIDILTTVIFADHGAGTKVTITTRFPSIALRDNFAKFGMKEGWSSSLDKLEDLLDAIKAAPNEINITRLIAAPRHTIFQALSDPKGLAVWWGPNGFTTTTRKQDFRAGGVWDYTMHGPDGTDYPNYVQYTEIMAPELIRYDHGTDAANPFMFKAVITLTEESGKTRVSLRLIIADAAQREGFIAFGAVEGGYQNLSRLDAFLSGAIAVTPPYNPNTKASQS